MLFTILSKPFHKRLDKIFSIILELFLFIEILLTLIFCIMDSSNGYNISLRLTLGWIMTYTAIIMLCSIIIFLIVFVIIIPLYLRKRTNTKVAAATIFNKERKTSKLFSSQVNDFEDT